MAAEGMVAEGLLRELRARIRAIESGAGAAGREVAGLGAGLEAELPWSGLPRAALHEVSGEAASGFVAALAGRLAGRGGALVWCRSPLLERRLGALYGPGTRAFGLDWRRLVLVRARDEREVLWAAEEALRCPAVAGVVVELARSLDLLASRRLQLAAEAGGAAGLLLRPGPPDPAPNAALTRWRAEPDPWGGLHHWRLDLWRCKGGAPRSWRVGWDEQALAFALAAPVADRADATRRRAAG